MKIVYLDTYPLGEVSLDPIARLGDFTAYHTTTPDQVIERVQDAEVVIVNKVKLMKAAIDRLPKLKLICVSATGVNNVDTEYAESKGIPVKNVPAYSTESVAEATFGLVLALLRNVVYYDRYVKEGAYSASALAFNMGRPVSEIKGKIWGIVGMGAIGRRVAAVAEAFGANVIHYSTSGRKSDTHYIQKGLHQLLQESDIVSIHAPLTPQTENLIGYQALKQMKKTAILVNVARGGIIHEEDLAKALNEDLIAGAGLDVFAREPLEANSPLLRIKDKDKLVLAPHSAWTSIEARRVLIDVVAQNINDFYGIK